METYLFTLFLEGRREHKISNISGPVPFKNKHVETNCQHNVSYFFFVGSTGAKVFTFFGL